MSPERYRELDTAVTPTLTPEERAEGWHFCPDWDYLLVGPGTAEEECCLCSMRTKL